jgi:monoamine oxidase
VFPHQTKIQALVNRLDLSLFPQYIQGDALFQRHGATKPERFSGAGAMELFRIEQGTYALIHALAQQVDKQYVLLDHAVQQVTHQENGWLLEVNANQQQKTFSAEHLILALPPRMVQTHLTASRWASPSLLHAFKSCQTWMSAQAKCVVTYDAPFWREQALSGQAFSQIGPMVEMHDASIEEDNHYALFGFIGWPYTQRQQYTAEKLRQRCIDQLVWLYGDVAKEYTNCVIKDWAKDTWVASSLDINEPSQHPHFNQQVVEQELHSLNLYLGGSEFALADPGYLEGAVEAVDRELERLAKHL